MTDVSFDLRSTSFDGPTTRTVRRAGRRKTAPFLSATGARGPGCGCRDGRNATTGGRRKPRTPTSARDRLSVRSQSAGQRAQVKERRSKSAGQRAQVKERRSKSAGQRAQVKERRSKRRLHDAGARLWRLGS